MANVPCTWQDEGRVTYSLSGVEALLLCLENNVRQQE